METYRVSHADEERAALEGLNNKGKTAARRIIHARILFLADQGKLTMPSLPRWGSVRERSPCSQAFGHRRLPCRH